MDFSIGSIGFFAIGFGLMFGASATGWFGTTGFFLSDFKIGGDPWVLAFWMFQVVFAATAATIVSGAMAERTKFAGYLIYSFVISALVYPIFGGWAWGGLFNGGGWLEKLGFIDFAGSTVVHSVGGWSALAGAIVLGPRMGKYTKDGRVKPILGHNMPLAALGVFILWLGWFGFNPGSTTAANKDIAMIFVNTNLAAAAGCILAMLASWLKFGKPEIGMSLNGALAGLVAITSPCATVTPGAISVHGVCGAWGTLSAGIFAIDGMSLSVIGVQLLGIVACFLWVFPTTFIMFKLIAKTIGLRVSPEEELEGLDLAEHAGNAYPDFEVSSYGGMVTGSGPGSAMPQPALATSKQVEAS
jgi:Amt family ammonium transporter